MDNLRAFCLFVGYGRSGHSAIGSIIDAHPSAVISHELNAVKRYFDGVSRDQLFEEIYALAQQQAYAGRHSSKADGGSYTHRIEGQVKQDYSLVTVLGDKKGAGTAHQFRVHGLEQMESFKSFVGLPVKIIHVLRNPYDIVAAGMARGHSGFTDLVPVVAAIREQHAGGDWLDVYHEDVVSNPRVEITRIMQFLGLRAQLDYLDRCANYLHAAAHRRRFEMTWPQDLKQRVATVIKSHGFLQRYDWEH